MNLACLSNDFSFVKVGIFKKIEKNKIEVYCCVSVDCIVYIQTVDEFDFLVFIDIGYVSGWSCSSDRIWIYSADS